MQLDTLLMHNKQSVLNKLCHQKVEMQQKLQAFHFEDHIQ